MKRFITGVFSSLIIMSVLACSCTKTEIIPKDDDIDQPGNPGEPVKINLVSGKVVDQHGNSMAGVKLRAENPLGYNMHINGVTDAEGKYSMQLSSIGGWVIYAWKQVEYNGHPYVFRLGMNTDEDYQPFTPGTKPVTKNFIWKLTGRIPDRDLSKENGTGYFGGTIRFTNFNSSFEQMDPGTVVTITFTPVAGAKYPDGSPSDGKIITRSLTMVSGVGQAYYINDLPLTTYQISAKTGDKTVKLGADDPDNFKLVQRYTMPAATNSGGSYESGIGSPNEHTFFMSL